MKKFLTLVSVLALLLCSCNGMSELTPDTDLTYSDGVPSGTPLDTDFQADNSAMFTDRDLKTEYDEDDCVIISLDGASARASSDSVHISDSDITITEEGIYLISGTLENGSITVSADETAKLRLIFDGVDVTSESGAPLFILSADKVFVTLAEGSENRLANGGSFEATDDNNVDAVVFSKQDLTLNGNGSLEIDSPVGHGIVSKDDLIITGGTYTVSASSHGIDANDSVRITNASLDITANKDGIHSENTDDTSLGYVYISDGEFTVSAEGDGISASYYVQINDGDFDITAGGGSENGKQHSSDSWGGPMGGGPGGRPGGRSTDTDTSATDDGSTSMKGIKAENGLLINGGSFKINSADDAINCNTSLTLNGGSLDIATGDDALHAEETLYITSGSIDVTESYEGLEATHISVSGGDIKINASDDGLNAAGGMDTSGTEGGRDGMYGGGMGGHGGMSAGNGSVTISGGILYVKASGDGIDANGAVSITGGHTTVVGPTQGDTATLDYDRNATVSGGTFIGTGASGMAQIFSESTQGVIGLSVGNQSAGTEIVVTAEDGTELLRYSPELNYAVVIFSCPDLVKGETYTVSIGSTTKEFKAS